MDSAKGDLAEKLKSANNILVTVSRDPSVDQLAACLGLTLLLNKLGKHAAAIFSGQVPSTIEFLQPEETLEKNTDSLRDFIIALDKSKADKLRYKVEDNVVRIFITPYRTSINQDDLEFSQGDFNVDLVVALGVRQQEDLDMAITAHGRILHDAVVSSINTTNDGGLGSISWHDPQASSLSELVTELAQVVGDDLLDSQIATALLTGIVATTDRFSNDKTTSQTMNVSARLMAAGANQQLVASKLEGSSPAGQASGGGSTVSDNSGGTAPSTGDGSSRSNDGTLEIKHDATQEPSAGQEYQVPVPSDVTDGTMQFPGDQFEPLGPARGDGPQATFELPTPQGQPSDQLSPTAPPDDSGSLAVDRTAAGGGLMTEAPTLGGVLTANIQPEGLDPVTDPLSLSGNPGQLLDHAPASSNPTPTGDMPFMPPASVVPQPQAAGPMTAPPVPEPFAPPSLPPSPFSAPVPPPESPAASSPPSFSPSPAAAPVSSSDPNAIHDDQTLADIENSVHSPHVASSELNAARDEVSRALVDDTVARPGPIQALGAQPLGDPLHDADLVLPNDQPAPGPSPENPGVVIAPAPGDTTASAPPPVPPPIPFQFGTPAGPSTPAQ
jgi:hypothetical protein